MSEMGARAGKSEGADAEVAALLLRIQTGVAEADALKVSLGQLVASAQARLVEATQAAAAAQTRLAEAAQAATAALAARTQITDLQAVIAAKSAHIQDAQTHADAVRSELDRLQTLAGQHATEAEGQRSRAQLASDAVAELLSNVRSLKAVAETEASTAQQQSEAATVAANVARGLANVAGTTEKRIADYEGRLNELIELAQERLETITDLLPGATAAGLAHAFDDRRKTFLKPSTRWQWLFVSSVGVIVALAASGLWHVYQSGQPLTWDELARLWVARLPIAGALIWLALHSSREAALAKRLEEDYGYKAAIATSFLGFQKQMTEIGKDAGEGSPLAQLCADTLSTIASPPGRIYDKHKLTVTPSGEAADAASRLFGRGKEKAAEKGD